MSHLSHVCRWRNLPYKGGWLEIGPARIEGMNQNTPNPELALRLPYPSLVHPLNGVKGLSSECQPLITSGTGHPSLAVGKGRRWEKPAPCRGIMLNLRGKCRIKVIGGTEKSDRLQAHTGWNSRYLTHLTSHITWILRCWVWLLGFLT